MFLTGDLTDRFRVNFSVVSDGRAAGEKRAYGIHGELRRLRLRLNRERPKWVLYATLIIVFREPGSCVRRIVPTFIVFKTLEPFYPELLLWTAVKHESGGSITNFQRTNTQCVLIIEFFKTIHWLGTYENFFFSILDFAVIRCQKWRVRIDSIGRW